MSNTDATAGTDEERQQLNNDNTIAHNWNDNEELSPTEESRKLAQRAIAFIIGNEFCERFSFYGIKAILFVYLSSYLRLDAANSTTILHVFVMMAYFFPVFGGMLSDSYLGKFRTILYLSLVYCIGNFVLSITAIPGVTGGSNTAEDPPGLWGVSIGLLLLAIGTGGIKPCVSSFGGDQFHPSQTTQIQFFFSMFYFAINAGSVLSMFFTPVLREVHCFGMSSCYPLAFGVPSLLMIVATIIFVAGKSQYVITPPSGNVVLKIFEICKCAIVNKRRALNSSTYPSNIFNNQGVTVASPITVNEVVAPMEARISDAELLKPHWLDFAIPTYGSKVVQDVKSAFAVLFMFLPLPLFWTLYDQTASRWVGQGQRCELFSIAGFQVKAEQMQITNSILILVMVPLFEKGIYPAMRACGFKLRPLQRMVAGMIFVGLSFIVAGILEQQVEKSTISYPTPGSSEQVKCIANCISISWQIPQYIILTAGEILFSITGLEFAYSQAPSTMKSVMSSAWLLTVAIGNLVVVVITGARMFESEAVETFCFAALVLVAAVVFAVMSLKYKYVEDNNSEDDVLAEQPSDGDSDTTRLLENSGDIRIVNKSK